jgi:hypothetical protein
MKQSLLRRGLLAALAITICATLAVVDGAHAQNLPTWSGSFTDTQNNQNYGFIMAGGNPANTGTTQITTYLIPLTVVFDVSDNSLECGSAPVTFNA